MFDAEFLLRLSRDPIGTAYAEGYAVSAEEIKSLLGVSHASNQEVVLALQALLIDREVQQSGQQVDSSTGS